MSLLPGTKRAKMSARKRFSKPLLFGSLFVGLAIAFMNRHTFFPDVPEIRAREHEKYEIKRQEMEKKRQKLLTEKKTSP